jgi:ferredoxin
MADPQSQIEVELLNANGLSEWIFTPKPGQSFSEAAEDAGLYLSTSCCAGACFTCCCRIKNWLEDVDIGLVSVPLVDIDEDQVLTCVGWLKDTIFSDWKFHKIVLQKLI